jgi:hypothetical protein
LKFRKSVLISNLLAIDPLGNSVTILPADCDIPAHLAVFDLTTEPRCSNERVRGVGVRIPIKHQTTGVSVSRRTSLASLAFSGACCR